MLGSASLIAFVGTARPAAARAFYETTLGLSFRRDDEFALGFDANGTMLIVFKAEKLTPAPHTVLGWQVADIRAAVKALQVAGVGFERYEGMEQDALGVWTAPGGAQIAWFKDPDGNVLSLSEFA